ncbi:hypothetical protein KZZ52_29900 [Dactylosporangium sp. AC04546]|uniref:hypothetical protein n=1 Tax=Dactylosporangium sp. AC04546 TaxID=2862460 RepID=UPI001EDD94DE|nr:hypothetical protein [Dactylosporangium sp. AC04546]WVK78210.1 hypothetical protein KZZ52_29900 [Dactylosporangium sp. AC04546]
MLPAGLWWLTALFVVAGLPVAPLNAIAYEATDAAAPAGTATEARMWTATATAAGTALGSAVAGAVADGASPRLACLVALGGALVTAAVAIPADVPTVVSGAAATPPRRGSSAGS